MPAWEILLILLGTFIVFSAIHFFSRSKRPFVRALISMSSGLAALALIDLTSGFTGVYIPVSLLSILVSVIGGVPGVTLILLLNLFF